MTEAYQRNRQPSRFPASQPKRRLFRPGIQLPLIWLSLSILAVGLIRSRNISLTVPNGAPIDETFHFGWVLDTVTALTHWVDGPDGHIWQADFKQSHPNYNPQDPLQPYSVFEDYWQGIGVYLVQALVQFVVPAPDMTDRLYLGRFVNIYFEVLLAWLAYIATDNVLHNRRLALAMAGILSFIPTVSTSAATVTPEVPAFAACLVLFIALTQLYNHGWSGKTIMWLVIGCSACLLTKNTAWPTVGVIAIMSLRRAGLSWRAFLLVGVLAGLGVASQLQPLGAAHWYREQLPWEAWALRDTRLAQVDIATSQLGDNALLLVETNADRPVIQHLADSSVAELRGQTITVGGWVRALAGTPILMPVFQQAREGDLFTALPQTEKTVIASGDWQFVQYGVTLPPDLTYARIALWQTPGTGSSVWYDGLVLTAARFSDGSQPQFSNEAATQGIWGGQPFVNRIQNGSAESQWWGIDWAKWAMEYPINQRLFAWQDMSRTWPAYLTAARAIFATLWGSFQNDVPGLMRWQIAGIGMMLVIGLIGCLLEILARPQVHASRIAVPVWALECWILWVAVYVAMDFFRSDVSGAWVSPFFYASGRFMIPALFPLLGLTLTGLCRFFRPSVPAWVLAGLVAAMFLLNLWMLLAVEWPYYNCPTSPPWSCIAALY